MRAWFWYIVVAVGLVVLAAVLGNTQITTAQSAGLFTGDASCGTAWAPDYSAVSTTGVVSCQGIAASRVLLSCTFMISALLTLILGAVRAPARTPSVAAPRPAAPTRSPNQG